jgi:tetratricopeptide (TPR) repeat protein
MKHLIKAFLCGLTFILLSAPAFAQRTAEEYLKASFAQLQRRDLEGAIASLDKAIELKPNYALAYFQRSRLQVMRGGIDASLADLDKAILIDPELTDAYPARAHLRMMKNDIKGALSDFDNAIVRGFRSDTVYSQRAAMRMMTGDFKGAIADSDVAISMNPNRIGNYLGRGSAREAAGDRDGAIADYNHIIQAFEKKEAERLASGKSERRASPFDLTSPVISGPEVPRVPQKKGTQQGREATMVEGQAAMRVEMRPGMTPEQMEYLPNVAGAYLNRGQIYSKKEESEAAIADFTKSANLHPFFGTFLARAKELRKTGDLKGAIADYSAALELRRDSGYIYFERGATYLELILEAEAEKDFAKALELDPKLRATIEARRAEIKKQREGKPG